MKHFFLLLILLTSSFSLHAKEGEIRLFAGNATPELAEKVAQKLGVALGQAKVKRFNDGEISIRIEENIRNDDIFVLQSVCRTDEQSVNDSLMELMLMIRTLKRSSAKTVTAILPYYAYARQDRKTEARVPISASDVAMLLETAGADRVVAIDLHCGQIQGFFRNSPVDNLYASTMFIPYFAEKGLVNPVIVSPDAGGVTRAKKFRQGLSKVGVDSGFAMIVKQRAEAGTIASVDLVGSVEERDAIIIDDIVDTAGTLCKAAEELKQRGARNVYACITHPLLSGPALERLGNSELTELVVSDTIPVPLDAPTKIKQVSVAPLLAEAIHRIHRGESVSVLFL